MMIVRSRSGMILQVHKTRGRLWARREAPEKGLWYMEMGDRTHAVGEFASSFLSASSALADTKTSLTLTMIGAEDHVGDATRDVHDLLSNGKV